jgi:hypothetical protein
MLSCEKEYSFANIVFDKENEDLYYLVQNNNSFLETDKAKEDIKKLANMRNNSLIVLNSFYYVEKVNLFDEKTDIALFLSKKVLLTTYDLIERSIDGGRVRFLNFNELKVIYHDKYLNIAFLTDETAYSQNFVPLCDSFSERSGRVYYITYFLENLYGYTILKDTIFLGEARYIMDSFIDLNMYRNFGHLRRSDTFTNIGTMLIDKRRFCLLGIVTHTEKDVSRFVPYYTLNDILEKIEK